MSGIDGTSSSSSSSSSIVHAGNSDIDDVDNSDNGNRRGFSFGNLISGAISAFQRNFNIMNRTRPNNNDNPTPNVIANGPNISAGRSTMPSNTHETSMRLDTIRGNIEEIVASQTSVAERIENLEKAEKDLIDTLAHYKYSSSDGVDPNLVTELKKEIVELRSLKSDMKTDPKKHEVQEDTDSDSEGSILHTGNNDQTTDLEIRDPRLDIRMTGPAAYENGGRPNPGVQTFVYNSTTRTIEKE